MRAVLAAVLVSGAQLVAGHPICIDEGFNIQKNREGSTCKFDEGTCCNSTRETSVLSSYRDDENKLSDACKSLHREVSCGPCSPWEQHLFATKKEIMTLCPDFCRKYYDACKNDLNLGGDFCAKYAADNYYCYPIKAQYGGSDQLVPAWNNMGGKFPSKMVGMYDVPGKDAFWILDQQGKVKEISKDANAGSLNTVLDIEYKVQCRGEMGLLGLAFAPDFKDSKTFYVSYIDYGMNTKVGRFTYKQGDVGGTNGSEKEVFTLKQPEPNHNGGTLLFEPGELRNPNKDKYKLYIVLGDGGGANDPRNSAQNLDSKFGKILRVLVSSGGGGGGYTIPAGNVRGEVWAWGLRNPWKCSFDKEKDAEMWCGDVGQDNREKITRVQGGKNYGWRNWEGTRKNMGDDIGYERPEYEYCHNNNGGICDGKPFTGLSCTAGFMYRGTKYSDLYRGHFIFADYQNGVIAHMWKEGDRWKAAKIAGAPFNIASFCERDDGEIYVMSYDKGGGSNIYHLPGKYRRERSLSAL